MRLILQLCLLVLMLLGAEKRAWGKVATSPQTAVRDWVQDSRLGGGMDAPPRQPTSGEAAAWDADMASAGDIHREETLTMSGPVVVTSRGAAFLMCPGAPPPFIGSIRTTTPAWVAVGPNVYAYVKENPWTSFDPEGLEETKARYFPRGAKGLVKLEGNRDSGEPLTRYNEHGKLEVQANHYESWGNKNLSWFNGPYGAPDKSEWEPAAKYGVTEPTSSARGEWGTNVQRNMQAIGEGASKPLVKGLEAVIRHTGTEVTKQVVGAKILAAVVVALRAATPAQQIYSVAFETQLTHSQFAASRVVHNSIANAALNAERAVNPALAKLVPAPFSLSRPPVGWTWQHATTSQARGVSGVLQLVPKAQHTPGSAFWRALHPLPNGGGGYSQWAIPAGAPPN